MPNSPNAHQEIAEEADRLSKKAIDEQMLAVRDEIARILKSRWLSPRSQVTILMHMAGAALGTGMTRHTDYAFEREMARMIRRMEGEARAFRRSAGLRIEALEKEINHHGHH